MKIKILGMGCPSCLQLEKNTREALRELTREFVIEKVTEVQEIMKYNALRMPALVIDEKVCLSGKVASREELKALLKKYV
jgi:small redox-active disulfide protein 2